LSALLLYCRPGFEPDAAAELGERAAAAGIPGHANATRDTGWLSFHCYEEGALQTLDRALPWRSLVFARQKLLAFAQIELTDTTDRAAPVLAALEGMGEAFGTLLVEHPDSDAGRPLSGLARSFGNALRGALRKAGVLSAKERTDLPRLHVFFADPRHLWLARSDATDSSPWPMGVPRLRLPPDAPSRSALKLEEALATLVDPDQRARWLRPGQHAADLGAAPGGWSWVLARNGVHVYAIDNGPLGDSALATGLVEPVRADGFRWQPPRPLDWLVCDMVEQPRRVSRRIGEWFVEGWCRRAIFNLKLPMKKRWLEVREDLAALHEQTAGAGLRLQHRARQLYHDREEVTVFAWLEG
jgi:23S rRNA (cytidine2498-2'-O)-methyltransferase